MTTTRKHRKKKWIAASVFLLMAGLLPAQASSPIPPVKQSVPAQLQCGPGGTTDAVGTSWGTCDAGGDCCQGYPEAPCTRPGGGFSSV